MPTYYVSDYEGPRNDDAVEAETLNPVVDDAATVETKVIAPPDEAAPEPSTEAEIA